MAGKAKAARRSAGDEYAVGTAIGNGDDALEGDGVMVKLGEDGAFLVPVRLRNATPAQERLIARAQRLVRSHVAVLDELDQVVPAMRDAGLSWASIGWVVGLSEAGARKRWGDS